MARSNFSAAKVLGVALSLLMLTGCQTTVPGPYPWSEGWREATVLRAEPADTLSASAWVDCRQKLSPDTVSKLRFAEVQYRDVGMGAQRRAVSLIKPGEMVRPEDSVLLNVKDCTKGLEVQTRKTAH